MKQLHFIVGIGRSGTTLLTNILNKHQALHCLPEANFLVFFLNHFKQQRGFSEADIELIFQQIHIYSYSHPFVGWEFNEETAKAQIKALCKSEPELGYLELCKHIYTLFKVPGQDKSQASALIDKNPGYTIYLDKIAALSPASKFIWLIRDYRANVLSRKQSIYLKPPHAAYNATRWKRFNQLALSFQKKNPEKVLLVRYEDLVLESDRTMSRIYEFLGVEATGIRETEMAVPENMSEFLTQKQHEQRMIKKYSDLSKPINADRVESWKKELSSYEIAVCEQICGSFAQQFGYAKYSTQVKKKPALGKHLIEIVRAIADIEKDLLIYFLPIHYKMKRFVRRQKILGFIRDKP
jgi:hypothetical protein